MNANAPSEPVVDAMPLLRVRGLARAFGGVQALRGIDFDLAAGEMLALIGPNGAGKSTCFGLLNGQLVPDAGEVRLDGRPIHGRGARAVWRLGVGRTFQVASVFGSLTALANVQVALAAAAGRAVSVSRTLDAFRPDEARALLAQVGLAGQDARVAGTLTHGDLKRLELAMALAHTPRLLLMDEPTAGMTPAERQALMREVRRLAAERGLGVLFTEHSMDVVFDHADRVLVLDRGTLIAQGTPDTVRRDPAVRAAYLGPEEEQMGTDTICLQMSSSSSTQSNVSTHSVPSAATDSDRANSCKQMESVPIFRVAGLEARYGRARVVEGVDLTLRPGEVLALMGRNGAGKSTVMKALMGLVDHRGSVVLDGVELSALPTHAIAQAGVGWVPEDRRVFADLTVAENLEAGRRPPRPGLAPWTPARLFEIFPNLADMGRRPAGRMSGGEQQMLAVARTLMGNPRVLLLDEPSEGVAPVIVDRMAQAVRAAKAEGLAVLLSEQNLRFANRVADRVLVLEQGRARFTGSLAALSADRGLLATALGL